MAIKPSNLTPGYGWNDAAGRYTNLTTGRFISMSDVRNALDTTALVSRQNMRSLSEQLQAGKISLADWQVQMAREIKTLHTAAAASANGGWAQMSQSDWGATGQIIKQQYKYLQGFANDIASGKQPLNGRLIARSNQYAEAGRGTFEQMRRRYERDRNGQSVERRVLGFAEHCEASKGTPGCVDLADRGWQPIGTLPPIGAATCRGFCKCRFEFGVMSPDGVVIPQAN